MAHGNPRWGACEQGGALLHLPMPIDPDVLSKLRSTIPKTRCQWKAADEAYWIHDNWLYEAEKILTKHYPGYDPYEGT